MSALGKSSRPDSITIREALIEIHGRLKSVVTDQDPAPWFEVSRQVIEAFSTGDDAAFIRDNKLQDRTWLLLLRGVLSGELQTHFSDGIETMDVPAWVWADAELETVGSRFDATIQGYLALDVFLPDEWQNWAFHQVYFDASALTRWLDNQDLTSIAGLPNLPPPHDASSKPAPVSSRQPPNYPFVSLAEAISWIAFGHALDTNRLSQAVNSCVFGDPIETQRSLENAVGELTKLATEEGEITVIGKYVADHGLSASTALTERINPIKFHDFAKFDVLEDTLRYGTGLTWIKREGSSELLGSKRPDAFTEVKVNRSDLLLHFPACSRPSLKLKGRPSYEDVIAWCRRWIDAGKGNGMDKAWNVFKSEPAHRGLSRDEVFRPAWKEAKTG